MVKFLLTAAACWFPASLSGAVPENGAPSAGQAPASPAPPRTKAPVPSPLPAPAITHLGGPRYELNHIGFNKTTRAIIFPAKVNMVEGLLEYAVVHDSGKTHESFLTTSISPFDLNVVLLLLNYKAATTFFDHSNPKAGAVVVKNPKIEAASNLSVTLAWQDAAGTARTAPLESLLLNIDTKSPATAGAFTYTGSMLMEDGVFMAQETGSILALYADAAALINNPRPGNENDDIWITDKSKVPSKGTTVTVTLTAANPTP